MLAVSMVTLQTSALYVDTISRQIPMSTNAKEINPAFTTPMAMRTAEPLPLGATPTSTSSNCAELAADPTRDPVAYALACAHEFGTQLPPYTETISQIPRTTLTTRRERASSYSGIESMSTEIAKTTATLLPSVVKVPQPSASHLRADFSHSNSSSIRTGTVIGASIGVVATFSISFIGGGLWYTRRKWLPWLPVMPPKTKKADKRHYSDEWFDAAGRESGESRPSKRKVTRNVDCGLQQTRSTS